MMWALMAEIQPLKAAQLRKLRENGQQTYVIFYYRNECRTCDEDLEELQDALDGFARVAPVFSVNCSVGSLKEACSAIDQFPALLVYNTKLDNPVPQQFLQDYDADRIIEFVRELARPNFLQAFDTMSLLEFLLTNAVAGRWFFMTTPQQVPEWWFHEFAARVAARNVTLLVQVGCDYEQYKQYEKTSFFDKIDEDGINLFAAIDGTLQFFPWEHVGSLDLDGNIELADQWATEILDAFDNGIIHGAGPEDSDEL